MNLFNDIKTFFLIRKKLNHKTNDELNGKKIVFNTVRQHATPMHLELFMAYLLARENAQVYLLFDDGKLRHWDSVRISSHVNNYHPDGKNPIKKIINWLRKRIIVSAYSNPNIRILNYSSILNSNSFRTTDIGDSRHAKSSLTRYVENELTGLSYTTHPYYLDSTHNCAVSHAIGKFVVESIKPDLFVTSHGIYSTWGPCYDVIKGGNIPTMVYQINGFFEKSIRISDQPMQLQCYDSVWHGVRNKKLSKRQVEQIKAYFDQRFARQTKDSKVYFGNLKNFKKIDVNQSESKVFGLFPNVIWDGNIEERNTIFKGLLDWIIKTVHLFSKTKNFLVIRFHPSEVTILKGTRPLESLVKEKLPSIGSFENIKVISSSDEVNTYELLEKIDIGLIYGGTLAQEMIYRQIPVIACGRGVYYNAGFTFEPQTVEDYRDLIINCETTIKNFQSNYVDIKEKLLNFSYWYFLRQNYHMPILNNSNSAMISYDRISSSDLDSEKNDLLNLTKEKVKSYIG